MNIGHHRPPDIFAPEPRRQSVAKYTLTVVGIALGILICWAILSFILGGAFAFIIESLTENASQEAILTHAGYLGTITSWAIILPIIYTILSRQRRPVRLLFRKLSGSEIIMALKYYGISTIPHSLILLLMIVLSRLVDLSDYLHEQSSVPLSEILLAFVVFVIVVPVVEEIFFRGYFYASLRRRHNFWPAFWISGSLFTLAHIGTHNLFQLIIVFALSYLITLAMEKTRNLWVPIIIHALNNFVFFLLTYLVFIT